MLEELKLIYYIFLPDGIGPLMNLLLWVVNFCCVTVALFISLYLYITHDDLAHDAIQPLELCNFIKMVREISNLVLMLFSICQSNTFCQQSFSLLTWLHALGTLI